MTKLKTLIAQVTLMKPQEQKAAYAAFAMVFVLMAVYFILRPVRDAMASDWSDAEVSFLWNIQFFLSTGIVMFYCWVINRISFKYVVPIVYGLFATSFMVFFVITQSMENPILVEKAFYLWVTAFSLLNLSVFWSFMSDTFTQNQSKRLFAFIAAGGSAGAIVGPSIPAVFAGALGLPMLMLIAALGLFLVIPIILFLTKNKKLSENSTDMSSNINNINLQAKWWSGFKDTIQNRYLLAIAVFILLYVFINSFVYFQQKNLLADFSRADRAHILGGIDWLVNVLTFICAFTVTSRLVKRLGMATTLASLPILMVLGMLILAIVPMIVVLLAIQTTRRVGNYAITRPGREMLFTQVNPDERFKAKPVIDVVVYRGGDALSGSLFALLSEGIGFGLMALSLIGAGFAACWAAIGVYLGRTFEQQQSKQQTTSLNLN